MSQATPRQTGGGSILESERAPEAVGPCPHQRRVGNLLSLSGIGPREKGFKAIPGVLTDADGNKIGRDIEAQRRSVFDIVLLKTADRPGRTPSM